MVASTKKLFVLLLLIVSVERINAQEFSAGINTENPNRFAVLHLVAPNGNQGLLLPKLNTSQRNALVLSLGTTESGLMVYDQGENQVYFWDGAKWLSLIQSISKDPADGNVITLSNGGAIKIGEGVPALGQVLEWDGNSWVPAPPAGVQSLTLSGTSLDISSGNSVDLSTLIDDADADPVNEIQSLSKTGNIVSLSNGGGSFTDDVDDADADPTNENQTVSAGTGINVTQSGQDFNVTNTLPDQVVNLSDGGSGHVLIGGAYPNFSIDVPNLDDADADPTNENQTVSAGTGINVTQTGQNFTVTNTTPDQVVNLSVGSLNVSISGSYPNYIIDVPSLDDADNVVGNEFQDLSLAGNILSLTDDGTSVDLSGFMDNTDDQTVDQFNLVGSILNLSLEADGVAPYTVDLSSINTDNQDLSLAGNTLSLTNDGTTVDLSGFLDNTDNQDLSLAGNTLSLTNDGTTVDLSGYLDNTDDQTVDQFNLTGATLNLSLENDGAAPYTVDLSTFSLPSMAGNAGNYLTTDGSASTWVPLGTLAQLNTVASAEIADGSVGEVELANSVAGNGIAGGAGTPLSVDLAPGSGMDFNANQLQMQELYPGGTTYDGGASTAIRSITFDSKGRFVSATSITVVLSDRRLKKEITLLDNSLEKIQQLNGYNYYLKSDTLSKELKTGVMAQEIKEVFPNLLLTRPDGYYGVDYQGLIPILLEAIKEQQVIIDDIKQELNQQKQINNDQESRITAMEGKLGQLLDLINSNGQSTEIN